MSIEKRKAKRLPTTVMAEVYDADSFEVIGKACVFDMSKTGIAFETNLNLDGKKKYFIRIKVPMEIVGEVVRTEEHDKIFRYGMKFQKLIMSDAIKMRKVIFDD